MQQGDNSNEIELHQHHQKGKSLKVILYWNFWDPFIENQPLIDSLCPVTSCIFTSDQSVLNQSHVVLFFVDNELAIYNPMPTYRQAHQRFVFATHHGTPFHVALSNTSPDYYMPLYNDSRFRFDFFNWTMTYRLDSDVVMRQSMGVVVPIEYESSQQKKHSKIKPSQHLLMRKPSKSVQAISRMGSKKKLIAWFPKHCNTLLRREDYVHQLRQYVPVDIYGICANSTCGSLGCTPPEANFNMLRREYKFFLAIETFWCPDYVTEGFYKALDYDTVPIVLGGADYDSLGPPHSFVNALNFSSVEALAEYLLLLEKNEELYVKYFDWKKTYRVVLQPMRGWCDLCRMAHDDNLPSKIYHDIKQWWIDDGKCENNSSNKYFK